MQRSIWRIVDNKGNTVKKLKSPSKGLYFTEQDAQGAATQFNNVQELRDGKVVQLEGAPFRAEYSGDIEY